MQAPISTDSWTTSIFFPQSSATWILLFTLGIALLLSTYQTTKVLLRHTLPRSCLTVGQFLLPEFLEQCIFVDNQMVFALTKNLSEHRKAEAAAQRTSTTTVPAELLFTGNTNVRQHLLQSTRWQILCTYWFLLILSLARQQILQILYCSLPLPESDLLNQCPVHKRRKITWRELKSLTYVHLTATCITNCCLLLTFQSASVPFLKKASEKILKSWRYQEKGIRCFSVTVSLLTLSVLCICAVQAATCRNHTSYPVTTAKI